MFNLFDFSYTQDWVTKQKPQWQVDMETKDRAPDLSNTTLWKIVQWTNEFFKSNPAILSKWPKEIFGGISQWLQNTATSIKNAGYGDAEWMAEQQKSFISDMLAKWYDKETIFKAMDQLKAQGKFQGSITENPITGTLSSIASAPLQALWTIASGWEDAARAWELAQQWSTSDAVPVFWRWLLKGWLGGLWVATWFTPGWVAVNTAFSSDTVAQPLDKYVSAPMRKWTAIWQEALGFDPNSEWSKAFQESVWMVWPLAVLWGAQKYVAPRVVPVAQKTFNYAKNLWKVNPKVEKAVTNKGIEEIYQAVNPTTRENKAQLRQRVDDLLPYIDEKSLFNNELAQVKERVDIDKNSSFDSMKAYEDTVGVKGKAETAPIIKNIQDKFIERTSEWVVIDEATSKIANELISKLKEFWPVLKDYDIIKVRRSWDKIIEKNKGFMQSAESNTKGEIFNEANKYFRDEIRKSNPEYAKYLEKAHKTIALSDILEATIQRRTGQSQGGILRRTWENAARVAGAGLGAVVWTALGSPALGAGFGYAATEWLLSWVSKLSGSSAKLARGKRLLLKQWKNDNNTNASTNTSVRSVQSNKPLVTKWPRLNLAEEKAKALTPKANEPLIKKSPVGDVQPKSVQVPEKTVPKKIEEKGTQNLQLKPKSAIIEPLNIKNSNMDIHKVISNFKNENKAFLGDKSNINASQIIWFDKLKDKPIIQAKDVGDYSAKDIEQLKTALKKNPDVKVVNEIIDNSKKYKEFHQENIDNPIEWMDIAFEKASVKYYDDRIKLLEYYKANKIPEGYIKNPLNGKIEKVNQSKKGSLNIGQIGKDLWLIKKPKAIGESVGIGKVPDELKLQIRWKDDIMTVTNSNNTANLYLWWEIENPLNGKKYLSISNVIVEKSMRGKWIATELYNEAIKEAQRRWYAGIASDTTKIENKTGAIQSLHSKFNPTEAKAEVSRGAKPKKTIFLNSPIKK